MSNGSTSPSITIHSYGICTHAVTEDGRRRTILTNASEQSRIDDYPELRENGVQPHVARLTIARESFIGPVPAPAWFQPIETGAERIEWKLDGVRIAIVNPASQAPNAAASDCIPHLRNIVTNPPPPPLLRDVDEKNTACHFDYPMVQLVGENLKGGAIFVTATVATSGPPTLRVTPFDNSEAVDLELIAGAEIALSNLPQSMGTGSDADFLLHFLTTTALPAQAVIRTSEPPCSAPVVPVLRPKHLGDMTGPGCSNTNYP
jgi:hypothetical protein